MVYWLSSFKVKLIGTYILIFIQVKLFIFYELVIMIAISKKLSFSILSAALALLFSDPAWSMVEGPPSSQSTNIQIGRSLNFLDQDQPTDQIDFLSTNFPELIEESSSLPSITPSQLFFDKSEYLQIMKGTALSEIYNPFFYLGEKAAQTQRLLDLKEIVNYRKFHPVQTSFGNFFSRRKSDAHLTIIEDIALSAHHIANVLSREGNAPVVFIGRTPCLSQVAYEELCKQRHPELSLEEHSIHLSFSGTPDVVTLRKASHYQEKEENIKRCMVTPSKLKFYEDYLTQQGMNKITEKFYIVDMLGTGGSLNSFLRLMRHYYETHLKREMPDIHFLCLYLPQGLNEVGWGFDQESQRLTFNPNLDFGIRPLEIKTTPLQLSVRTIMNFLDNDLVQQSAVHGVEFPAQKWREEFKDQLFEGGVWQKEAYEILRPMLSELVAKHESEISSRGAS